MRTNLLYSVSQSLWGNQDFFAFIFCKENIHLESRTWFNRRPFSNKHQLNLDFKNLLLVGPARLNTQAVRGQISTSPQGCLASHPRGFFSSNFLVRSPQHLTLILYALQEQHSDNKVRGEEKKSHNTDITYVPEVSEKCRSIFSKHNVPVHLHLKEKGHFFEDENVHVLDREDRPVTFKISCKTLMIWMTENCQSCQEKLVIQLIQILYTHEYHTNWNNSVSCLLISCDMKYPLWIACRCINTIYLLPVVSACLNATNSAMFTVL